MGQGAKLLSNRRLNKACSNCLMAVSLIKRLTSYWEVSLWMLICFKSLLRSRGQNATSARFSSSTMRTWSSWEQWTTFLWRSVWRRRACDGRRWMLRSANHTRTLQQQTSFDKRGRRLSSEKRASSCCKTGASLQTSKTQSNWARRGDAARTFEFIH